MVEKHEIQEWVEEAITTMFDKRDQASSIQRDVHAEHHEWLAARISKEQEKEEFWRTIRTKSIPWAIVAITSSLGAALWTAFRTYFTEHWK